MRLLHDLLMDICIQVLMKLKSQIVFGMVNHLWIEVCSCSFKSNNGKIILTQRNMECYYYVPDFLSHAVLMQISNSGLLITEFLM